MTSIVPSKNSPVIKTLSLPFNAAVSGPLLFAILYYPEKLRFILPKLLRPYVDSPRLIKTLKYLVGLGLIRNINSYLSHRVINNWQHDAKFIKSQELVLVTGGASGIGESIAEGFAKKGTKVVIFDIHPPTKALPSNVFFYQVDVTSTSQIRSVAAELRATHGNPTVLINNAGISGHMQSILATSEDTVRKVFEVNTISHFWTVKEFLPAMIERNHGHVVTIASMLSYLVLANLTDYSCSKASALAFHEGLASELKNMYKAPNVRTTCVNPGWVRTPLTEPIVTDPRWTEPTVEPDQIANAVINQVMSGRSGHLVWQAPTTIRGWPSWLQTGFRNRMSGLMVPFQKEAV